MITVTKESIVDKTSAEFEEYMLLLANFDSFEDFVKARDEAKKELEQVLD